MHEVQREDKAVFFGRVPRRAPSVQKDFQVKHDSAAAVYPANDSSSSLCPLKMLLSGEKMSVCLRRSNKRGTFLSKCLHITSLPPPSKKLKKTSWNIIKYCAVYESESRVLIPLTRPPLFPLMNKSDFSQLTSLMLSSNFMCA